MQISRFTLALLAFGTVGQAGHAVASGYGKSTDYVYVETNIKTTNGNSIAAFARQSDGSLKPVPGSPFLTGGEGVQFTGTSAGAPDSDQDIITNLDHTLLFAVNSGSDSIAVFHIHGDGSLTAVEGSPFPSGGNNPISLDLEGNVLFVANKSGDPGRPSSILPNYTSLYLQPNGKLEPTGDTSNDSAKSFTSTVSVEVGGSPTQVHVVPGTDLIFGTDFMGGLIQRFRFNVDGRIRQLPPVALPASEFSDTTTPRLPLGVWHHPYLPLLYVGFVTDSKLGVYQYSLDGQLKFLRAVPNSGAAICWIRTNREGTRLYTTDTGTNSVTVYNIVNPETPAEIQNFVLSGLGNALQFDLSTDETSLYVLSSRGSDAIPQGQGNVLHSLTIATDGKLSEKLAPTVFSEPNSTRPQGVTVVSK
jgi:hypothetical protein